VYCSELQLSLKRMSQSTFGSRVHSLRRCSARDIGWGDSGLPASARSGAWCICRCDHNQWLKLTDDRRYLKFTEATINMHSESRFCLTYGWCPMRIAIGSYAYEQFKLKKDMKDQRTCAWLQLLLLNDSMLTVRTWDNKSEKEIQIIIFPARSTVYGDWIFLSHGF
jgi:hypothetical protein